MANLEGKLSQYINVVMYTKANAYLTALNLKLKETISTTIRVEKSYLSKYEVTEELRARLSDDYRTTEAPGSNLEPGSFDNILPYLQLDQEIITIATSDTVNYELLESYMDNLADVSKNVFSPPLLDSFEVEGSMGGTVYPIPQSSKKDPRRGARLLVFKEGGEEFPKAVRDWLINNALLYGFTLYQNYGLYYIGFEEVRLLATDKDKITQLINRFQSTPIETGDIQIEADTVQKFKDPRPVPVVGVPGSYKPIETESFLLGGGIDGSNVPDDPKYCPGMNGILNEDIITSTSVMNTSGNGAKGKVTFVRALEAAFGKLKSQGYTLITGAVGDSYRGFNGQRRGHVNILNARKLWEQGKPWSKNGTIRTPNGPKGSNKPPWVANPCSGYHTQGQATDIYQGGKYKKGGKTTTFKDDILSHGPLYSALFDSGVRRIGNEWWHWSIGETNHEKNKSFSADGDSPADFPNFKRY